jgi:hypothetical protein
MCRALARSPEQRYRLRYVQSQVGDTSIPDVRRAFLGWLMHRGLVFGFCKGDTSCSSFAALRSIASCRGIRSAGTDVENPQQPHSNGRCGRHEKAPDGCPTLHSRVVAGREGFEPSEDVLGPQSLSRRPHSTALAPSQCLCCEAEREGFEPPDLSVNCFQDSRLKPLGHLSALCAPA